jgi:hypothetical protein
VGGKDQGVIGEPEHLVVKRAVEIVSELVGSVGKAGALDEEGVTRSRTRSAATYTVEPFVCPGAARAATFIAAPPGSSNRSPSRSGS